MSLQAWQRHFAAQLEATEAPRDPGMQVYHHNLRAQFRKALALSFPVVAGIIGESAFDPLAERFRQRNPSRSGDLHPSGAAFPAFLASEEIALAELAGLEWAWQCALIAPDRTAIDVSALSRYQPEEWPSLRLRLQPSFSVLRWRTAVVTCWQTHRVRHATPVAGADSHQRAMESPRPEPEQAWLVGTPQGPILQGCNATTALWLEALAAGATLATALGAVEQTTEVDALGTLQQLFRHGAVIGVDLRADDHA